jgi:hypothetical protein
MAADLIIGAPDEELQEQIAELCRRFDLKGWTPLDGPQPHSEETMISIFNLASLCIFTDYIAGLEGHTALDAIAKTKFRNLPWWLDSMWLPLDFYPPKEPVLGKIDSPFVGSSVRVLEELATIREMSTIDVAQIPPAYFDMRNDYTSWFSRPGILLSDEDAIRWIWNALRESAQISVEKRVPMLLAP